MGQTGPAPPCPGAAEGQPAGHARLCPRRDRTQGLF